MNMLDQKVRALLRTATAVLAVMGAVVLLSLPTQAWAQAQAVAAKPAAAIHTAKFVGSAVCGECHGEVFERWQKTRMANIVVDPKLHPEKVLGNFGSKDPLVSFSLDNVAFMYGSKWKQRYFTKLGDDYFAQPAQWDVQNHKWAAYHVAKGTDWWTAFYPDANEQRPTGPLCDGCHSTNYNIATKQVSEWNVGCEKCHGPGSEHADKPTRLNIVNPAQLAPMAAIDVCMQCHSQGQLRQNPLKGVYYDWPVGYQPGDKLSDVWKLEEHKLGEETFTHWPEDSAHKNRMQGNDFVQSEMFKHGVTCWSCHDVHGTNNQADLLKPVASNAICLSCHATGSPNGPTGTTLTEHTHHVADSKGSECVSCHMPKIAKTIADVNVRSHTFRFITPTQTEQFGIPNPCTTCHADKKPEWAKQQLQVWSNASVWRVGQ